MRIISPAFILFISLIAVIGSVQAQAQAGHIPICAARLPPNLEVRGDVAEMVGRIHERSGTFRTQCTRIAATPNVHITIQLDPTIRSECRAFTIINRRGKEIRAQVHLPLARRLFAELIGHEFEHIIEQIEGLDLRTLAMMRSSGVHQIAMDLYETDRAQSVGKIVDDEVDRAVRASKTAN